ncbi:hypothetical protein [Lysobacter tyrosinilyticus]
MSTLAITLILLLIVTIMVLLSSNVAFFEQRSTINENRGRLVEQAAEYAVNLGGEYLKANRDKLISDAPGVGWLDPNTAAGTARRWVRCFDALPLSANHPCLAERDNGIYAADSLTQMAGRRKELYFFTSTGTASGNRNLWTTLSASTVVPDAANLDTAAGGGVGGTAKFPTTTDLGALLCRVDTSCSATAPCTMADGTTSNRPTCRWTPTAGNRIAVNLVGSVNLAGENASAAVKETWASVSKTTPMSAVPLVASGFIQGLGNAQVVAAPNGAGFGVPVSMWSPNNICVDGNGGCTGVGSIATCQLDEYLQATPVEELKTTCATSNNACGCPALKDTGTDFLSGHSGSVKREGIDILDVDGNSGALPDIIYYPGAGKDDPADPTDDSLFEFTFGVDYEASEADTTGSTLQNCAGPANCAEYALKEDLGAEFITCAELNSRGEDAEGLLYITDSTAASPCDLPDQVGRPDNPAIVVVNEYARLNGTIFYGMLFVRSNNNGAYLRGNGQAKVFGAVVVEGDVKINGGIDIVYDDTAASGCTTTTCFPKTAKFARVPGSWLDSSTGF